MYAPVVVLLSAPVYETISMPAISQVELRRDRPKITPSLKLIAMLRYCQFRDPCCCPGESYIEVPRLNECQFYPQKIVGKPLLDFTLLEAVHINMDTICESSC